MGEAIQPPPAAEAVARRTMPVFRHRLTMDAPQAVAWLYDPAGSFLCRFAHRLDPAGVEAARAWLLRHANAERLLPIGDFEVTPSTPAPAPGRRSPWET